MVKYMSKTAKIIGISFCSCCGLDTSVRNGIMECVLYFIMSFFNYRMLHCMCIHVVVKTKMRNPLHITVINISSREAIV